MGTIHTLVTRGQNRGINSSPRAPEYHYKKGGRSAKKGENLKRGEPLLKFCQEEKTQRKLVKLLPGILEKATIAHTQIQKESNFTSLKGENNHLRL